jgi:NADPH2:quinone reductase
MSSHAIRVDKFGPPEVMKLEERQDLKAGPGQILVTLKAAGVNPVETYLRAGTYANKPDLPYTPGTDGAGVVEAVGIGVEGLRQGDRVYVTGSLTGTYAERALCVREHLHPLPGPLSFSQGAALGVPYATAWRALFQKASAQKGETVFIHGGSGGVGTAAIQLAGEAGLKVVATAGTAEGLKLLEAQGAVAFDHFSSDYGEALLKMTGGHGPDIILEMLANVNLGKDLELIAPRGRIVIIGNRGLAQINPRIFMARECLVTGLMLFNTGSEECRAIHEGLGRSLESGAVRPVIGQEFPLAQAAAAHQAVLAGGHRGKIVLIP